MEDLLLIWFHPFCIAAAVKCFSHCKLSIRNTMSFLICECLATTHTLPHTYTQHVHNAHTHNTGIHTWAYMHIYTHFHIHIHNNAQCTHTYTQVYIHEHTCTYAHYTHTQHMYSDGADTYTLSGHSEQNDSLWLIRACNKSTHSATYRRMSFLKAEWDSVTLHTTLSLNTHLLLNIWVGSILRLS